MASIRYPHKTRFAFFCGCPKCGAEKAWKRSPRKHGKAKLGHYFADCQICGHQTQATDNGPYSTNPAKNRIDDERGTHQVSARLTDSEYRQYKASGLSGHEIFRIGLDNI